MSMNIEMLAYTKSKMYDNFLRSTNIENSEDNKKLFDYVLGLHGLIFEESDAFVILNNEYWEDYNLFYELSRNLEKAFGMADLDSYEVGDDKTTIFSDVVLEYYNRESVDIGNGDPGEIIYLIKEYKNSKR